MARLTSMTEGAIDLLKEKALEVLRHNLEEGYDPRYKRRYRYVAPSKQRYHWQWFWDSCFHAIALSHLDIELAKNELINLVAAQEKDGFIGQITYWGRSPLIPLWGYLHSRYSLRPRHTELIQTPLLAQAVYQVYSRSEDASFLEDMVPRLDRYYRWLAAHRDPDGDSLISVISPYETGMDHKPAFDEALGLKRANRITLELKNCVLDLSHLTLGRNYSLASIFDRDSFSCEDVMVNCVYAQALSVMGKLHREMGTEDKAEAYSSMAQRVEEAVLEKCYDASAGAYFDLYSRQERKLRVLTVTALFPLILETISPVRVKELVDRHLLNEDEFWLEYPVPSVSKSEEAFHPGWNYTLWRGPTWLNANWFLAGGLRKHGYDEIAERIVEKSVELVTREGFREFYNPFTGEGLGARGFGWSTLVVDMVSWDSREDSVCAS